MTQREAILILRKAISPFVAAWTNVHPDEVPHKHLRKEMFLEAGKALRWTYEFAGEPWRKFDRKVGRSWPEEGRYWVALRNGDVSEDDFNDTTWTTFDPAYVTHWQPITVPSAPSGEES